MFVNKLSRKKFSWQESHKEKEFRVFEEVDAELFCKKDT